MFQTTGLHGALCWGLLVSAHLSTLHKYQYPETEVRDAQRQPALQSVRVTWSLSCSWRARAKFCGFRGSDVAEERGCRPCQQPGICTHQTTASIWGVQGPGSLQLTCIHGTASTSPTRQELWWALVWDLTPRPGLLGGSLPAVARGTVSCSRFLVATLCTQLKYSAKRQTRTSHCLKIILSSPCLH